MNLEKYFEIMHLTEKLKIIQDIHGFHLEDVKVLLSTVTGLHLWLIL